MILNPTNPNIIYAEDNPGIFSPSSPGRVVMRSADGGITFTEVTAYSGTKNGSYTHGDIRCFKIFSGTSAGTNDRIYIGSDGGIIFTNNQLPNFILKDKNGTGLNITQFYSVSGAELSHSNYFVAGAQDNGGFIYDHGVWSRTSVGGDEYEGGVENTTQNNLYLEASSGGPPAFLYKNIGGAGWSVCYNPSPFTLQNNLLTFNIDHVNNNKLFTTYNDIFTSTDHGSTWVPISNFASQSTDFNHCRLFASVAVDPLNPQHILACYEGPTYNKDLSSCNNICTSTETCNTNCGSLGCPLNHKFFETSDGGTNWIDRTFRFDKSLNPNATDAFRWDGASKIAFNPDDHQEIWITFGNFNDYNGIGVNRVNHSIDGGLTWTEYSENLPPFSVNSIVAQRGSNGGIYIATDVGVFYRDHSLTQWECYNDGLPIPLVTDLEIDYCRQKLLASTFGRGVWEGDLVPAVKTIQTTSTWASPTLYTDLIIPSGITLTISSTVNIARGRKITVQSGGVLNVDGTITNDCENGWTGSIHVEPGGILNLKANANITFIENGKILIDDDATNPGLLTIDGIPKVNLNGINTMIDIRGKVDIKNNSTFTFFHQPNNTVYGFIKFANTSLNPSRNITAGSNCNINFTGVAQYRKILEIDQETFYVPPSIVNFTINKGKVELASNSRIQPDGLTTIINLSNVKFTSNTPGVNNGHRGVSLLGQPNVTVSTCIFEYGSTGINAFLTAGGSNLNIDNSTFNNNTNGLLVNDKGCNLFGCSFNNNVFGFTGNYMSNPSVFTSCIFSGNTSKGCYWLSHSNASLTISGADIRYNNGIGVSVEAAPLIITCSNISNNNIGIDVRYGGTLTMNNQAKVIATGNYYTINAFVANNFILTNGNNDLTPSGLGNHADITGSVISGSPIPQETANKWNASGTFSSSDYYLVDLNTVTLVTLIDANPLSTALACGIDPCPNPPCSDPCKPPCDYVVQDALVYCPDCGTINTLDFPNKKLNDAISKAIDKVNSHESQNYRKAIKLFSQILNVDFPNPNKHESYLLNLGYLKLQETLGNAFLNKQIIPSNTLADEVQNIIDIENNYIDKANQQKNYYRRFLYTMDKAQTYRIANRRDLSLNVLNNILSWVQTDDLDEVNNFICTINTEIDALEGRIDLGSIAGIMNQCTHTNQFRLTAPAKNVPLSNNDPETMISIFPNPINNIANIRTNIENARIILFDNVGQSITDEKINYDTDIDLSSVSRGIYVLKIENLKTSEYWIKKLIVQ